MNVIRSKVTRHIKAGDRGDVGIIMNTDNQTAASYKACIIRDTH